VTDDSAFKKQVRARMAETGEKYTVARRTVAGHDPGQPPLALRVFLNPHVDLDLTDQAEILTVQELRIEEIGDLIRRRLGRAAGVSAVAVFGDLDHVRVDIHAARPGVARGHGGAEASRLRAELEELTGKPVKLHMVQEEPGPQESPGDARTGRPS
jgi:KH domain